MDSLDTKEVYPMKKKRDYDVYNETSNTMAGINTPTDQEDVTPTDLISETVEKTMDNIQKDLVGEDPPKSK